MAAKKQKDAGEDNWLERYTYWKGQYTVRNNRLISYTRELIEKKTDLVNRNPEDREWLRWYYDTEDASPEEFVSKFPEPYHIKKSDIEEIISLEMKSCKEFPYVSTPNDGMTILNSIVDGNFPPYILACKYRKDSLMSAFRLKSVRHNGVNNDGDDIFLIDTNAEINVILKEIRQILVGIKNFSGPIKNQDAVDMLALKDELRAAGSAYRPNGDESRAVGLLMFDYLKSNEDSDVGAYRWVKNELAKRGPKNFSKANSGERQYQRWLANTRLCIDAAEVLEI